MTHCLFYFVDLYAVFPAPDPDIDWILIQSGPRSGSKFRRAKMTQKNIKKLIFSSFEVLDVLI
jgi:hypothetical protein